MKRLANRALGGDHADNLVAEGESFGEPVRVGGRTRRARGVRRETRAEVGRVANRLRASSGINAALEAPSGALRLQRRGAGSVQTTTFCPFAPQARGGPDAAPVTVCTTRGDGHSRRQPSASAASGEPQRACLGRGRRSRRASRGRRHDRSAQLERERRPAVAAKGDAAPPCSYGYGSTAAPPLDAPRSAGAVAPPFASPESPT